MEEKTGLTAFRISKTILLQPQEPTRFKPIEPEHNWATRPNRRPRVRFVKKIEFANFTCTFGKDHGMLFLFEEVVWPAFQPMANIRQFKDTQFFFHDTRLIKLVDDPNEPVLCLSGRFVKNTKLKREQIFRRDKGLIENHHELETAPSSLFTLILNNHRLLYVREVAGAPDISTFCTTVQKFLTIAHGDLIKKLHDQNKTAVAADSNTKKETGKSLVEKYPYPDLRITPLTDREELKTFIDRFDRIQDLTIVLARPNQEELDNEELWDTIDKTRDRMGSKKASLHFSNKTAGLDDGEVYAQCNAATGLGNSVIRLAGLDPHGGKLKGNNDDFQLSVEAKDLSRDVIRATPSMVQEFSELVNTGVIKTPRTSRGVFQKINNIISRLL